MENVWLASAVWLGLALFASIISIRVAMSVALVEIMVGAVAGNTIGLHLTEWVNFLAGFGAILLTFLAGTEIDSRVVRKHFWSSMTIGVVGFFAPYVGVLIYARYAIGWSWPEAQIAGISLSTTSVAVVYAVMVETGFNKTELGKIILAACFVNDLGTVLALGIVFAHFDLWLAFFGAATAACPRPVAAIRAVVLWQGRASRQRTRNQVHFACAVSTRWTCLHRWKRSCSASLSRWHGASSRVSQRSGAAPSHAHYRFHDSDAILFSEGGLAGRFPRGGCCSWSHYHFSSDQDGYKIRRHPAADENLPLRTEGRDVHDASDVHGTYVWNDLGAVRSHQPHHRPREIYDLGYRCNRQRRGADTYRTALVPADLQAD